MNKRIVVLLALLIFPVVISAQNRDWLKRSDLIFEGEVLKLHSSTVDIPDASDVGLVRVTDILKGESTLKDYLQQVITVRFRKIDDMKPGQRAIFYTTLWLSGRGLAVHEVGTKRLEESGSDRVKEKTEVRNERTKIEREAFERMVKDAEEVLAARVLSLKRLPSTLKETEHDPMWTEAEIAIEEDLKSNRRQGERMKITFAASKDVMWYLAPKLVRGQANVFLLIKPKDLPGNPPNYVVIDRAQVLDMSRREEIKRIVR